MIFKILFIFLFVSSNVLYAQTTPAQTTPSDKNTAQVTSEVSWRDKLGITYFTFFNGPGIHPDFFGVPPSSIGTPDHRGINAFNLLSVRYRLSESLAVDFQNRFRIIFNNQVQSSNFSHFQWESPRVGVSGKLASGTDWVLSGAVNTDLPYVLPIPFSGYVAQSRTTLLSPGMFASFNWTPKNSRFSVFTVLTPRLFIYQDRTAEMSERLRAGFSASNKPELVLALLPTLNYHVSDKFSFTVGSSLSYIKQVGSDWNPFQATIIANESTSSWLLEPIPVSVGFTFTPTQSIRIFPYIETFPIAAQRFNANTGTTADLLSVTRLGMWVSGNLL